MWTKIHQFRYHYVSIRFNKLAPYVQTSIDCPSKTPVWKSACRTLSASRLRISTRRSTWYENICTSYLTGLFTQGRCVGHRETTSKSFFSWARIRHRIESRKGASHGASSHPGTPEVSEDSYTCWMSVSGWWCRHAGCRTEDRVPEWKLNEIVWQDSWFFFDFLILSLIYLWFIFAHLLNFYRKMI